ncbi:hypothetical protein P9112_006269 [Eukaryota sp. TZLM1-RC]
MGGFLSQPLPEVPDHETTSPSNSESICLYCESHQPNTSMSDYRVNARSRSHPSHFTSSPPAKRRREALASPSNYDSTPPHSHCSLNVHHPSHSFSFASSLNALKDVSTCQSDVRSADLISDRSVLMFGVKSISVGVDQTLLLTHSGEVYCWGNNCYGEVLPYGPEIIKLPIKLPLYGLISISAGDSHLLALSSEGKLYKLDRTVFECEREMAYALNPMSINIPYSIKEVYGGDEASIALTHDGRVVAMGCHNSYHLIKELVNVVCISVCDDCFVAVDGNGDFFYCDISIETSYDSDDFPSLEYEVSCTTKIAVTKYITPNESLQCFFSLVGSRFYVVDITGDVWEFVKGRYDDSFNNQPTKVPGLTNIGYIIGYDICAAIDNNGKVFVWGDLSRISDLYQNTSHPLMIEAFTNIEGISVGRDFLFAYNKNTVWAWGRNDGGQLGIGDLIDRPQPVKLSCGSEILGSFQYPKQPMDRMFSGLIKLIYFEYLQYLNLFGNRLYSKARFYTKCAISKKVAQFAKEVINSFEFLKDPRDLTLNENICDLQLRLSTHYNGPKVINTRVQKLDVCFDEFVYDPQILSFFPKC